MLLCQAATFSLLAGVPSISEFSPAAVCLSAGQAMVSAASTLTMEDLQQVPGWQKEQHGSMASSITTLDDIANVRAFQ